MERISRAEDWIEEIWKIALIEGVHYYEADVASHLREIGVALSWLENDIPVTVDFD